MSKYKNEWISQSPADKKISEKKEDKDYIIKKLLDIMNKDNEL